MAGSFRMISWGLLLVALDVRIGSFDVLPDVVGYLMIAFSLHGLKLDEEREGRGDAAHEQRSRKTSRGYGLAGTLAVILGLLALGELFTGPSSLDGNVPPSLGGLIVGGVGMLLRLFMVDASLTSLERQLRDRALADQAASVAQRRVLYLGVQWLMLLALPFRLNLRDSWELPLLLLVAAMLVVDLLLFFIWRKAAHTVESGGRTA
ncbi:hypothetical protein [Paenibacillus puerhi]|uniref:hypothetical protein n=1 Tax=Paenibacillus puerhi TaxID=2692622 RepID=UPI00135AD0DD|nr:hypothetical protein [Paenibacillus puerhi]